MSAPSERRKQEDSISRSSETTTFRESKETRNKSLKHPENYLANDVTEDSFFLS